MPDHPQYNHDPERGETHGKPEEQDPHSPLNTPVSEIEKDAEWQRLGRRESTSDVTGMGRPQTSDTRGTDGDPVLAEDDDHEERNPAQSTPRGVVDAEAEAVHRVEEDTGVPLGDDNSD
jgi:hypothetical protein